MLPSTGYFKTINCPFYESGTCDRPYCHFKHAKREDAGVTGGTAVPTGQGTRDAAEFTPSSQAQETKTSAVASSNNDMLQHLVTEAVKKVLADRDVTEVSEFSDNVVSQVVQDLKPTLECESISSLDNIDSDAVLKHVDTPLPAPINKQPPCVYNPTPIAELRKRHIPIVSYLPTRESRVSVKRKCSPDVTKLWGGAIHEPVKYKPTTIVNAAIREPVQNYVPTCKTDPSSSKSHDDATNEYLLKLREEYYPKSKRRREEYVPKNVKAPLKSTSSLGENTVSRLEPDYGTIHGIFSANSADLGISRSEDSRDSCPDLEAKFSDDEPVEDGGDFSVKEKVETKSLKCLAFSEEKENASTRPRPSNVDEVKPIAIPNDESGSTEISEKSRSKGSSSSSRYQSAKKHEESKEEKRSGKDKKSGKVEKSRRSHDSSSKNKDEKHKRSRSNSDDKRRSASHKADKDRHRDSRDKKSSGSRKDKHVVEKTDKTDKKQEKRSSRSDVRSSRDSKKSSSSSRRTQETTSKKDRDTKKGHSRSSRKSHTKSTTSRSNSSMESARYSSSNNHIIDLANDGEYDIENGNYDDDEDRDNINGDDNYDSDNYNGNEKRDQYDLDNADILSISDSDHDVQEECLKIFQEYQVSERRKPRTSTESPKEVLVDAEEVGKKRLAHPSAATMVTRQIVPSQSTKKVITPQQKLYERWRLMREAAAEKAAERAAAEGKGRNAMDPGGSCSIRKEAVAEVTVSPIATTTTAVTSTSTACVGDQQINGNGRIRIAHVPYARSLTVEKRKVTENVVKPVENKTPECRTAAQTAKSGVRLAHIPQVVPQLVRPEPLRVTTQKFPLNVRQYYVNIMHDVCIQIYTNAEDAAQRAVKEEFACHERCKALPVYKNSCTLAAHRLRKEVEQNASGEGSVASVSGMVSHEAVLAGKTKGSWSVLKTARRSVIEFKGAALYCALKKWIMTEQDLRDNGFPRPSPDGQKGRAKVYTINSRNQVILSKVPNERICGRCGNTYMIDKHGFAVRQENCIYHWGRKFTTRGESKYSCCQQYGSAGGCCDAKTHVWSYIDYENLRGYVRTFPKDTPVEEQGIYALDCEMCYTTQGLELTRITVIDEERNVVYESLVKPDNPIIDYNTRFSGITEEHMRDVSTTLLEVQATLLTLVSDKTILVGHSLESDFKALKIVHDTVVDTSVMFPHKNGYPHKRALKNLCSEYLRKIIQNDVGGHDSKEDAVACMELVLWKAKEEAKLQ